MENTQQRRLDLPTHPLQFSILRYVPDIERGEARNVGVIVRALDGTAVRLRLATMGARVWAQLGPAAKSLAENLQQSVEERAKDNTVFGRIGSPRETDFLDRARREFTGHLQFTEVRGLLAESVDEAAEQLFQRYVAPIRANSADAQPAIAPSYVRRRMWSLFERYNLLRANKVRKLLRVKGQHASWTFDLGYKDGSSLINSIALNSPEASVNLERALILKGMIEDVRKQSGRGVKGMAIAALPRAGEPHAGIVQAQEILKDTRIDVVPFAKLPSLVEQIREDLGVAA